MRIERIQNSSEKKQIKNNWFVFFQNKYKDKIWYNFQTTHICTYMCVCFILSVHNVVWTKNHKRYINHTLMDWGEQSILSFLYFKFWVYQHFNRTSERFRLKNMVSFLVAVVCFTSFYIKTDYRFKFAKLTNISNM